MALLRHASTVALLTLASRVLGFARDAGVAALFGTGVVADASVAGLALAQLARRLLGEGALNAAILPRLPDDPAARRRRAGAALLLFAFASLALAALVFVFMPQVVALLAPGFPDDGPREEGAVLAGRLAIACLPLALLAGVLSAFANASGRFARPAMAPAIANVAVIALLVALWLAGGTQMTVTAALAWLAAGAVAGALTQFVLNLFAVPRGFVELRIRAADLKAALPMLLGAGPTLLAAALPQLRFLLAASAASGITGGVAALFYATRLVELPLGLVGASTGAVLLPALAGREGVGADDAQTPARGLEAALALTLPAALGLAVLAQPIVAVLFERGAFDAQASQLTATALALLALTLPIQAVEKVLVAMAFADGQSRFVAQTGFSALVTGAVIGFVAVEPLGMAGPALGVLVSSLIGTGLVAVGMTWRGRLAFPPATRRRIAGLVGATLAMALAVAPAAHGAAHPLGAGGLTGATALAGLVLLGIAVYLAAAHLLGALRVGELRAALRK